jgi:hypothetical protein
MMIEVFKTNVTQPAHAKMLIGLIHANFDGCTANFDLSDCDKILRIASGRDISIAGVVDLVTRFGFEAQVLSDDIPEVLQF